MKLKFYENVKFKIDHINFREGDKGGGGVKSAAVKIAISPVCK